MMVGMKDNPALDGDGRMGQLLLRLLTELETVGRDHEELYDSEVREAMGEVIMQGFVRSIPGYEVPKNLGMYDDAANAVVSGALACYIASANQVALEIGLTSFHSRLAAIQNRAVRVNPQTAEDYEELFGHTPPEWYDVDGNVIWDRVR